MGSERGERDRLAALDAALERLQQDLADLRADVAALRSRAGPSLAGDHRCPACGCRKVLYARNVLDRSEGGRSKLALAQPSIWREKGVGEFEVYVCTGCGLCEWHVKDLAAVPIDGERFRVIEEDDESKPAG